MLIGHIWKSFYPPHKPVYTPQDAPPCSWVKGNWRYLNMHRGNSGKIDYLQGDDVDWHLEIADYRGYITLPFRDSRFWLAWYNTWWNYCGRPGYERPFIYIRFSGKPIKGAFDYKIMLHYDLLTVPFEIRESCKKLYDNFRNTLKDVWNKQPIQLRKQACHNKYLFSIGAEIGEVYGTTGFDEPIRVAFDYLNNAHIGKDLNL